MPTVKQAENFRLAAHAALKARRLSITALARSLGYSRSAVSRAINRGEFPAAQQAIGHALGVTHFPHGKT